MTTCTAACGDAATDDKRCLVTECSGRRRSGCRHKLCHVAAWSHCTFTLAFVDHSAEADHGFRVTNLRPGRLRHVSTHGLAAGLWLCDGVDIDGNRVSNETDAAAGSQ